MPRNTGKLIEQTHHRATLAAVRFATMGQLTILTIGFALGIAFSPAAHGAPGDLAAQGPAVPLEQSSECDPNYSGACVPIASDVDCEGGSGNGPEYVDGPVTVDGDDIYELDRDGNGTGCES
jgi:hypothetical protein